MGIALETYTDHIMPKVLEPHLETGNISVHTGNIIPIIKKSFHSDKEIFPRELVSDSVDATQKISHLASIGQYSEEMGELKVKVSFDEAAKTISESWKQAR